jgi:hypothetical protein
MVMAEAAMSQWALAAGAAGDEDAGGPGEVRVVAVEVQPTASNAIPIATAARHADITVSSIVILRRIAAKSHVLILQR